MEENSFFFLAAVDVADDLLVSNGTSLSIYVLGFSEASNADIEN